MVTALLVVLFSSATYAYDDEILFREIPWGSSIEDTKDAIKELNFIDVGETNFNAFKTDTILGVDFTCANNEGTGCYSGNISGSITVAGYDVNMVMLYFAYIYDNEAETTDSYKTSFYGATYQIIPVNVSETGNDIKNKLCDIYGECEQVTSMLGNEMYLWKGANDTFCSLSYTGEDVEIGYAWKGGDDLIDAADVFLSDLKQKEEAGIYGNGDTSGL